MSAPDANARCPRCGGGFHCGACDPTPCACGGITLSAATTAQLRAQYDGCLCLRCLAALQAMQPEPGKKKPAQS
ncbi:MAG: cysteine-rich CWC family protein [Rhizobacter sp.]|nr:cysteine-rich CWC family protein [Rhizobacter sp.]